VRPILKSISINLPFGIGGMTIEVSEEQRKAAWALYVELATRVAGVKLEPGMGSAREALTSLHSLFETSRSVLREAGAGAADGPESVGPVAIDVLNKGLRPFLVKWHTRLGDFEAAETSAQREKFGGRALIVIDESRWPDRDQFYEALEENRRKMQVYIDALAQIAGVVGSDT